MRISTVCLATVLLSCLTAPAQDADGVPYLNAAWLEELPGEGFGYRCLIRVNEVTSDRLDLALQFKLADQDGANVLDRRTGEALLLWPERWTRSPGTQPALWRPEPVRLTVEFFRERANLPPGTHRIEAVFDVFDFAKNRYVASGYVRRATFRYTLYRDGRATLHNEGTVPTVLAAPAGLTREEAPSTLAGYGLRPKRVLGTLRFRAGRPAFDGTLAFGGGGILTAYPGSKIRLWDAATGALARETAGTFVFSGNYVPLIMTRQGLHDAESGKLITGLEGGVPPVLAARRSADGTQLFTLGAATFTVWRMEDGKKVREVPLVRPDGNSPGPATITPCGRLAAIVREDGKRSREEVFDTTTGKRIVDTTSVYGASAILAISKDGKTFAAPVYEWNGFNGVALFDTATGRKKLQLAGTKDARTLALSPRVGFLAVGGERISLFAMTSGECARQFKAVSDVTGLSFSPDDRRLTADTGQGVKTFEIETGRLLAKGPVIGRTALSLDGSKAVTLPWWGDLVVWDPRTGKTLAESPRHERVVLDRKAKRMAALDADGTVRVWDLASGMGIFAMKAPVGPLALGPLGRRLAAGRCGTAPLIWYVDEGRVIFAPRERGEAGANEVAISPSSHVAVAWGDKWVRVYNHDSHEYVTGALLETHARGLSFSWDSCYLGMSAQYGLVEARVKSSGAFRQVLKTKWAHWLAYSPDGRRVAIGGEPPALFDPKSGERVLTLQIPDIYRPRFVFSPDGKRVLAIRDEEWIAVFDTADGRLLRTMKGDLRLNTAAFSPDGKSLHTVVENGAIVTWKWE